MINTIRQKINSLKIKFSTLSELKSKILYGSTILGIGNGSENALRLIRNIILAKLLIPDVFGLMAIIMAVNVFFESFTQIGLKEAIIQDPKGDEKTYLNGAFWLGFIRGISLFIVAFITIPWIANFYDKPDLIPMMRLAFVNILLTSLMSPKAYSELKQIRYNKWVLIFHGGNIIGVISTIILGILYKNLWALIIGMVIESLARLILSYIFRPFVPTFQLERESINSLLKFAKGMFGLPILFYLFNKLDIFILGKFCSSMDLGIYNLVQRISQIPFMLFTGIIVPLLMPIFSSIKTDINKIQIKYLLIIKCISCVFFLLLTISSCFASDIIAFLYSNIYTIASPVFIIFNACIALRIIGATASSLFFSMGKPEVFRAATFIRFLITILLIVPLVKLYGMNGAAMTSLISLIIWFIITLFQVNKTINLSYKRQLVALFPGLIISVFFYSIYSLVQLLLIGN